MNHHLLRRVPVGEHDTLSSKVIALYGEDFAYIHAAAFGGLARSAAPEIVRLLKSAAIPNRKIERANVRPTK
jgi:hypothetical protein